MDIHIPDQLNVTSYFLDENLLQGRGDNIALHFPGKPYTYRELAALTNRAGNVLKDLDVDMEDRVYLALRDTPEFVAFLYAVQKIGAEAIVGYTYQSPKDYRYEIQLLRPKVVVVDESCIERMREACAGERFPKALLVLDHTSISRNQGEHDARQLLEKADDTLEAAPTHKDDFVRWGFTGGSTGKPKAMAVTHSTLVYSFASMQTIMNYSEEDIVLPIPKMFFGYGRTSTVILPFRAGASAVIFPERTRVETIFELIERYRPTILVNVPTMMRKMLQFPEDQRPDMGSIRLCTCAGEALSAELYHEWRETFDCEVINMLGSTEMGYVYVSNRPGEVVPGSVGKPIPGYEVKIVDEAGRELPDGQIGVLMAKGPTSGFFYRHHLRKSRSVFRGEWVYTGDLFEKDADGYLWFHGRADELLKVSGVWVSPLEIERIAQTHPDVSDCAVVGVKDADGLDRTKAFVVLKDGLKGDEAMGDSIRQYVRERLSPHKVPRLIAFVDNLPKNPAGKVDRKRLRQEST